jgi:SagB-type dehydrogenase family enzyme
MNDIMLPPPQLDLDFPLMEALQLRRTIRKWKTEPLSIQEVSDILWCACGETKPATKRSKNRRTMPSACNSQLVHVYAALPSGVYRYVESEHKLMQITDEDIRSNIGTQKMMKSAPFGLIYAADFGKSTGIIKSDYGQKMFVGGTETGFMSQNVYLYCAAAGFNTVILALTDRQYLKEKLKLDESSEVIYTQIVGKAI